MKVHNKPAVILWSGQSCLLGGAMWVLVWSLIASSPEAQLGGHREPGKGIWIFLSFLLILVGVSGLYTYWKDQLGKLGKISVFIIWITAVVIILGHFFIFVGFEEIWFVPFGSIIIQIMAYVLFAVSGFRIHASQPAASLLLIVGSLLLFAFNPEDSRAWFALPFGIAWVYWGYATLKTRK